MFILLLIPTLIALAWAHMLWKARKLPPGPIPLPLFGNGLQFALDLYREGGTIKVLQKWQKQYGSVFTFWMGPMPSVNICDWQTAQDVMVKKGQLFSDKFVPFLLDAVRHGYGVIASNGQILKEQRRFAIHTLRNFGLGRTGMEERIMLEVDYRSAELNDKIDSAGGEVEMDVSHTLDITVGNVINRMLFTDRFTKEKEAKFFDLKATLDASIEAVNVLDMLVTENNSKFPVFKERLRFQTEPYKGIFEFFDEQINERLQDIKDGKRDLKEPEDFVDAFLAEVEKNENEEFTSFTIASLRITLLDLWLAGQETSATTLYWALSYLTANPEFIDPLQKELDLVTQKTRPLSLQDRPNTPFLNAMIIETLRCSALLPMNMWRTAAKDFSIGEYEIPKGTATVAQISFNPQRFIDNPEYEQHVVSFGLGKRACLGEALARAELYLILGNLICRFNFKGSTNKPPGMEALNEKGSTRKAKRYQLVISKRDTK